MVICMFVVCQVYVKIFDLVVVVYFKCCQFVIYEYFVGFDVDGGLFFIFIGWVYCVLVSWF